MGFRVLAARWSEPSDRPQSFSANGLWQPRQQLSKPDIFLAQRMDFIVMFVVATRGPILAQGIFE
jgi:hypothetical protein